MKASILVASLSALCIASCSGSKALIKDQGGSTLKATHLKCEDGPLLFRFSGGQISLTFRKLGSFSVDPTVREIYAGETWVRATISFKKDKTAAKYQGWIRQLSKLNATTPAGKVQYDMVSVQSLDFTMGKAAKKAAGKQSSTPGTIDTSQHLPLELQ